jgi:hypothetical protein
MIKNLNALRSLINDGISLIPVKGASGSKRPFGEWGDKPTLTLKQLLDSFEFYENKYKEPVDNVAIRTGAWSNGAVCIDVDTKHKEGFGAIILNDFRNLYPDVYTRLRIDKTPSGGLHFYYRIADYQKVAGLPQMAGRKATDEELRNSPKRKEYWYLEFKAEGGLSHCYPSEGYIRTKESGSNEAYDGNDMPLGILTVEEHQCLIATCKLYNEIVKIETSKIKGNVENLYSENPFEHFNKSEAGARVLYDEGWGLFSTVGKFERYQRPGKKDKEISATFNLESRIYRIFTTNADIDARGFTPAGMLCHFKFNNDFQQLYQYLVASGYGKLKPSIEKNIIKNAVRAGIPIQGNISDAGKREYQEKVEKQKEKYQYGIFWEVNEETGAYRISREYMYRVGRDMGFRSFKEKPVLIDGYIVRSVEDRYFFDKLKDYIIYGTMGWKTQTPSPSESIVQPETEDVSENFVFDLDDISAAHELKMENLLEKELNDTDIKLLDAYESFLQNSGKFTLSRLPLLDTSAMLKATKRVSYKFYQNCYIKITEDGKEKISYENMQYLIWDTEIINRKFEFIDEKIYKDSIYYQFVNNAIGWSNYVAKCVGFMAHDYRDEEAYFILATEKMENPNEGGGSGKNIFCNLFRRITSVKVSPGSMIKKDNQFLQSWNYQRIFVLADLPKKFDYEFFKEIVNGEASVRKLYKDEFDVGIHDMPKFIGSTNFSFDIMEPGIRRRVRALEFGDYYIKLDGVSSATGKRFPTSSEPDDIGDWDEIDFMCFDNIMINCIQIYLKGKCRIEEQELSNTGWMKQFELKYTHLFDFFNQNIEQFKYMQRVDLNTFNYAYETFKRDNSIKTGLSGHRINEALVEYCKHHNINFAYRKKKKNGEWSDGLSWRDDRGITVRGRIFIEKVLDDQPEEDSPF